MMDWLSTHEATVRLVAFLSVFSAMTTWELLAKRRKLRISKIRRWSANLALVALNTIAMRLVMPLAAVSAAVWSADRDWGLFNLVDVPFSVAFLGSVLILDLAIYLQHVLFHAVPLLWRLHIVHHADLDFDVTTGTRFHTVEIALSVGIKWIVVALLGAPVVAVIAFEVILNATAMFNHANVRLPSSLDRVLRWFVVTPDMHRVHHSTIPHEHNSNFGFNLPWWDRLLGTYRAQPEAGHTDMTIGISTLQQDKPQSLGWMLLLPFRHVNTPRPPKNDDTAGSTGRRKFFIFLILIVAITSVAYHREALSAEVLQRWLESYGSWSAPLFVLAYTLAALLFFPGSLLTLLAGAMFGVVAGTLLSLTAATLGAALAFLIARNLGAEWIENRLKGGRFARLMRGVQEEGWRFVAFTRLVPLFPYNALNYAYGLTGISFWRYTLTSAVCMLPGAAAYSYLGYAGRETLHGSEGSVKTLLVAVMLLASVAYALPMVVRRLRKSRQPAL